MKAGWLVNCAPVSIVRRSAQSASHMLARKTSEQRLPIASHRVMLVISSAARLNDVMRHCGSTVNTPSEMLSMIASAGGVSSRCVPGFLFAFPPFVVRPRYFLSGQLVSRRCLWVPAWLAISADSQPASQLLGIKS
jgi:hypothetical protein